MPGRARSEHSAVPDPPRDVVQDPGAARTFRADIQGLRAIAVLVVVAFHAGLPVPGGFVGVDVFFVISGFVITAMLQREWRATGRIDLRRFYLRRFKRLTPALAVVVTVTVVGALVLLSPLGPQQTVAKTGLGAMLLSANVVITRSSGDYFDAPAAANPLLHMWSLSVEEQFYLAFPLLLLLSWRVARRWPRLRWVTPLGVALVSVVSFALAVVALDRPLGAVTRPLIGFYGPVSRAWEFAVGALLFLAVPRLGRLSHRVVAALGVLGVGLMTVSLFGISESTPFPGPWTLLPVSATLLVLLAGAGKSTAVSRMLSSPPLVAIGDWSYSIYLWHWPFIVFATVLWPSDDFAVQAAAVVSVVPALAGFRWLESPIRRLGRMSRFAVARLVAVVVLPALAVSAGALHASTAVLKPRLESRNHVAYRGEIEWQDHDYTTDGFHPCTAVLQEMVDQDPAHLVRCQQSKPGSDVDLALIGDSHVEHLFIGLMEAFPERNIMYFTAASAPSMDHPQYAAAVGYATRTTSIETVLVTSFWRERGVARDSLAALLRTLQDSGKTVFITDDLPDFPFAPFGCKYRANPLVPTTCSIDASTFTTAHRPVVEQLSSVLRDVPGVQLLRTARYLCADGRCSMTRGRDILYADRSHLNVLGSRYVVERMLADYPMLGNT